MKILMMIPLWRRVEIVRLFVQSLERTLPDYAELIPFFILSPEDPEYEKLKQTVDPYIVFEYKNKPLGEKKNKGLEKALQLDWDYYIDMGSDNVWTSLMWSMYKEKFNSEVQYFGMKNIYFIDIRKCKAVFTSKYHLTGDDNITAVGPGRCIKRNVIEDVMPLWVDKWNRGMDGISHHRIDRKGYPCDVIDNKKEPVLLDIKTETNLNPFMLVEPVCEPSNVKQVYEWFGLHYLSIYNYTNTQSVEFEDFREQVLRSINIYGSQKKAFNIVNTSYEVEIGKKKYANYNSYKVQQTKKLKK